MESIDILIQIIALKRLKKKGLGEKTLFDLLMAFRESGSDNLFEFIKEQSEGGKSASYKFSGEELKQYINILSQHIDITKYLADCKNRGIEVCTVLSKNFPKVFLKERVLPVFFYSGDISLLNGENVAIVGTRSPSGYGIKVCENLVNYLGNRFNIVSGGASGIDSVAHKSALKVGTKTIVVLGSSIDVPYPTTNKELFDEIVESGGLIVSQYGPQEEFNEYSFVNRNRYIVELSRCVIVVEGGEKSGARITGEYALSKGKALFAVPGPITSENSFCPNILIHKGAKILYSEKVIGEFLNIDSERPQDTVDVSKLNQDEIGILGVFENGNSVHIDDIAARTNNKIEIVSSILLSLEMKGIVEELPGKIYRKRSY